MMAIANALTKANMRIAIAHRAANSQTGIFIHASTIMGVC